MLVLGARERTVEWSEAGITLTLVPLPGEVEQELAEETTEYVRGDNGEMKDIKRDVPRFMRLIGRRCIKAWTGVVDEARAPVDCTPEAIDAFMSVQPAQDFVLKRVRGLGLWLADEVDAAKKD